MREMRLSPERVREIEELSAYWRMRAKVLAGRWSDRESRRSAGYARASDALMRTVDPGGPRAGELRAHAMSAPTTRGVIAPVGEPSSPGDRCIACAVDLTSDDRPGICSSCADPDADSRMCGHGIGACPC